MKKNKSSKIVAGELIIPDTKRDIGYGEFEGNSSIFSVTIPGTVKTIDARAFANCENLEKVILQEGIEGIESNVFSGCKKLRKVVYPDSVRDYQGWTFWDTCLDSPVLNASETILVFCPDSVTGKEWTVPDTVKTIGFHAFIMNEKLERLHLPEDLEEIERLAFVEVGIRELTIPYSVRELPKDAFFKCEKLERVSVLNPETKIADGAFYECENLKEIIYANLGGYDKFLHMKGQFFLMAHLEGPSNSDYISSSRFKILTGKCAKGNPDAMEELSEFFEQLASKDITSQFFPRAANFWRYKAYVNGNEKATKWFEEFFAQHHGERLDSVINENLHHRYVQGILLNQLGYDFFESDLEYSIEESDYPGLMFASVYDSEDFPDEDGFGATTYYKWWFLDENLQRIHGTKSVVDSRYGRRFTPFTDELERAIEILKHSNDLKL